MKTADFNTVGGILTAETKNVSKEHETQLDALIKRCILLVIWLSILLLSYSDFSFATILL